MVDESVCFQTYVAVRCPNFLDLTMAYAKLS